MGTGCNSYGMYGHVDKKSNKVQQNEAKVVDCLQLRHLTRESASGNDHSSMHVTTNLKEDEITRKM